MTNQSPEGGRARRGRNWAFAAAALPLPLLLLGFAVFENHGWRECVDRRDGQMPCSSSSSWFPLATLGFWVLTLASTVLGLLVGLSEGRRRRGFAQRRWIRMTVVGLVAPWALLTYALGYGLGQLLPARRPSALGSAHHVANNGGWQQAVQLYQALAGGQPPPAVYAPDLPAAGTVYLDVPFRFSRLFATDVTYRPGGMIAVGSPSFVAGAAFGRLIGTSIGYARAAGLSRRHWRGHDLARVVVDASATWCLVRGQWLRFDHHAVTGYQMTADQSCILTFATTDPLRLHGPSAWCHAVLFAYLRGRAAWQMAPYLQPVAQAVPLTAAVPR
ncbi:hypothetical protein [Actinoplanes sp. NPDC089786]|uniref:hypothetical protein n=1 Tax=Actinoplanes sp. NPDC089786 TaxID=3155185 RepID=UPI0034493603